MRFPLETEIQLLRIIQEALTNVRKHAQATRAWLHVGDGQGEITFTVGDDGQGFDFRRVQQEPGQRFGLQIMRERAEQVGGRLAVVSTPGRGTQVTVSLPKASLEGGNELA